MQIALNFTVLLSVISPESSNCVVHVVRKLYNLWNCGSMHSGLLPVKHINSMCSINTELYFMIQVFSMLLLLLQETEGSISFSNLLSRRCRSITRWYVFWEFASIYCSNNHIWRKCLVHVTTLYYIITCWYVSLYISALYFQEIKDPLRCVRHLL